MTTIELKEPKINNTFEFGKTTGKPPWSKRHQVQEIPSNKTDNLQNLDESQSSERNEFIEKFLAPLYEFTDKVLSEKPEGISSKLYPYETLDGGMVKLHDIFKPIFLDDDDLIFPKEDADAVLGKSLGYNKQTDAAVLIVRNSDGIPNQIIAHSTSGQAYLVDFITGEKMMDVEKIDDKKD